MADRENRLQQEPCETFVQEQEKDQPNSFLVSVHNLPMSSRPDPEQPVGQSASADKSEYNWIFVSAMRVFEFSEAGLRCTEITEGRL